MSGRRPCPSCAELVAVDARYCEHCGHRLEEQTAEQVRARVEAAPDPEPSDARVWAEEFDARESQQLARDLYEAHAKLLRHYRKQVKRLERDVSECEQELGGLASGAVTEARTASIQSVLERLEGCGDRWEELQLEYNRASEELDEEYSDRCAEIEVDIELPDDLQTAMSREMLVTTKTFDRLGERIHSLGRVGNGLLAGATGRWFGASGGAGGGGFAVVAGLGVLATGALLHFIEGAEPRTIGVAVAAPAMVFVIALISRSARD